MSPIYDILIIGGGIVGLATSIGLVRKGHNITVVESQPSLRIRGSIITIPVNAANILSQYGIYDAICKRCDGATNHQKMRRYNGELISDNKTVTDGGIYGLKTCAIHRADLQETLFLEAQARGVRILFDHKVVGLDEDNLAVMLADGKSMTADLIIAADGINSKIRTLLGSTDIKVSDSSAEMVQYYIPSEVIESDPKLKHLMDHGTLWAGPGRVSLGCPIRRDGSKVWTHELCHYIDVPNKDDEATKVMTVNELKAMYADFEPEFVQVLSHAESIEIWKLQTIEALSHSWVSKTGRVILIGDAAHSMLPHFGQGAAMGIEDGATVAECLGRTSTAADIARAFRNVEAIRKPRVALIQNVASQNAHLMMLPDGESQMKRDELFKTQLKNHQRWDGTPVDTVPASRRDPQFSAWVYGHDAISYANRELDKTFLTTNE